jgi:hypothetical protein
MTSSTAAPSGANAKKLLVVGLLACLLLVVLWQNLGGSSSPPTPAAVLVSTPAPAALATVLKPRAALSEVLQAWPAIELPQLLAHNPFQALELVAEQTDPSTDDPATMSGQLPPSAGSQAAETTQATSQPPLQINAILSGGRRPAVLIGQRLYYEQDEIAGEWRIQAIHPNRVALEPLASSSAQPVAVSWSANGRQSPDNDQADQNQAPQ